MIRINKININNYKSIYNSKDIVIEDRITVLAGKNESGKTNVLKALDTYYNDSFTEEDVPTKEITLNPTISVDFSILGKDFNNKFKKNWLEENVEYTYTIERSKKTKDVFSGRLYNEILKNIKAEIQSNNEDIIEQFEEISNIIDENKTLKEEEFVKIIFEIFKESIMDYNNLEDIVEECIIDGFSIQNGLTDEIKANILDIVKIIKKSDLYISITKIFDIIMPEFKYFDNFDDMIPDEIDISELKEEDFKNKYRGFINLLAYLGVTLDEFSKEMQEVSRIPQTKLDKYSNNITLDYQNIYKQEKLKIALNKDGNKIYVNIYDIDDNINPKKPSQRSKGLQWFLSFYLMLNNSKQDCILLIDEPGLYLHASAQEDILNFFENKLNNYIIYTTHSPYLIDTNNMLRIKLVTNDRNKGEGTIIENKYYKCSDLDTVTPLITAIGYNMAKSPLEFGGGLNVITEGVSDRYYILAFLKLHKITDIINIIPSQGARIIHLLVSIAIGWNIKYIVFLDTDQGYDDAKNTLKDFYEDENEYNEHIFEVINKSNSCIEDVFSKEDKKKLGIGKSKKNKLLIAKNFYDKVKNEEIMIENLSEETNKNIKHIIDILNNNI